MTLTETRPVTAASPAAPSEAALPATADHKRLGRIQLAGSLVFLLAGAVLGVLLRGDLSEEADLLGGDFFRTLSLHATLTPLLFLAPVWVGLATYLVPLQIGASRLALPRLHALATWLHLVGGALLVVSYIVGPPRGLGIGSSIPVAADGAANAATQLWITSLVLVSLGALLAAVDLVVTIATMRTPGMTFGRVPLFTWGSFATSLAVIIATPVFLAGLALLHLDQRYGGSFFAEPGGPGQAVWQHMIWLFGRPEIYLFTLPGLGAACDIVATHARRALLGDAAARIALGVFAVLSFTAYAAGTAVRDAIVLPTYSPLTALVAVPVALLALVWLASIAKGKPRFHVSLAFLAGFLGLLGFGALNAAVAGAVGVTGGAWAVGHAHVVAFGAPTLLALAALYHWAPKIWGRPLAPGAGGLVFLLTFGGFFLNGLGTYLLGYEGAPLHVDGYDSATLTNYSRLAAAGGTLLLLGLALFAVDVVRSAAAARRDPAPGDPYGGATLEWATASPPPPHNFDAVPEVRSATPLADLRTASAATNGGSA